MSIQKFEEGENIMNLVHRVHGYNQKESVDAFFMQVNKVAQSKPNYDICVILLNDSYRSNVDKYNFPQNVFIIRPDGVFSVGYVKDIITNIEQNNRPVVFVDSINLLDGQQALSRLKMAAIRERVHLYIGELNT